MQNRISDVLPFPFRAPSGDRPAEVAQQARKAAEEARRQLDRWRRTAEDFVSSHPVICLAAAAAAGIALGWWVKRK